MPARKQTFTHAVAARRHAATHACTLLRVCLRRHGPGKRGCESCLTCLSSESVGNARAVWHRKGVWSRRGSEGPPRPTVSRPSVPRRAAAVRTVAGRDHRNDTACCSRASWSSTREPTVALGMRGDVGEQEGVGRRYSLCAGTNAALALALLALTQPACGGGLHGPAFDAERNAMRTKPPGGLGAPGGGGWLFGRRKESAQDVRRRVVAIDLEDVVAEAPAGEDLALGVSTGRIGTGGRSASNGGKGGEGRGAADSLMGGRRQLAQAGGEGEKGNVCPDCGPLCVETKVAKPMRGECYGPTPVRFYKGDEVQPGQNLWRVQYLPLRVCVQTDGQGNRRAGAQEGGLQRMTPSLLELDVPAIQDRCQSLWQDIDVPPSYFHTCNDPTGTEEAQIAGYTLEEFDPLLLGTFRQSVAQAMNNLKQNNSGLSVTQDNIGIIKTFAGTACSSMNVNETIETETEKPVDINGTIALVKVTETQVKTTAVTLQDNPCECTGKRCLLPPSVHSFL